MDREPLTSNSEWTALARPDGGDGHRFYSRTRKGDNRVYIVDNSGRYPDEADDGALYIDFDRTARVTDLKTVCVPVDGPGCQGNHVMVGSKAALWLKERFGLRVEFDEDTHPFVALAHACTSHYAYNVGKRGVTVTIGHKD